VSDSRKRSEEERPDTRGGEGPPFTPDQNVPVFDFETLSGGRKKIYILLGKTRYELKRTRSERLVLHK